MSVNVTFASTVTAYETLETNVSSAAAAQRVVTHTQFNTAKSLTSGTAVPVTILSMFEWSQTGGVDTCIDLTALPSTNNDGGDVDATGLRLQIMKIKNTGTNTCVVNFGAANGYLMLGAAWVINLLQDQEITVYGNELAPEVGAAASDIDTTGTAADILEITLVLG